MSRTEYDINLVPFKELLLKCCGLFFEKEREQTLIASLGKRMASLSIDRPEAYHGLLLRDREELLRLVELLTVNETYFFREPEYINLMADKLLPEFLARRGAGQVRILSAGCSTGEEPYSIAMMLRERYGSDSERLFSVTGVDIDSSALAVAQKGLYGRGSFRGMDKVLLERYFQPADRGEFRICDTIRNQVGFEVVNLLGGSYPQRMQMQDIILYRNVSIYFPQQVQREIFGRLAGLLGEGGCLLVGATETIHHDIGILSLVAEDSLFFFRKIPAPAIAERRGTRRHHEMPVPSRPVPRRPSTMGLPPAAGVAGTAAGQNMAPQGTSHERSRKQQAVSGQQNVKELFDTAMDLARGKRTEEALAILDAITEQDDAFVKAHALRGSLLLGAARFEEARAVCDTVIRRDPLCLEAHLMLGMIARQTGNDEDAFKRFREAIYLDVSCWLAHFYTAEILFAQKDGKRARKSYEAAARILEQGSLKDHGQAFFPLSFNAEQFIVICRHKLSLLAPQKG